jgi:hypothetical protein
LRRDPEAVPTTTSAPAAPRERSTPAPAAAGPHASVLRLQRAAGNAVVQRTLVQRSAAGAASGISPEVEDGIHSARGGGRALDDGVRSQMEGALGADLSGVRVHTDSRADALSQALGARAFTTGRDVFFRQGEFSTATPGGKQLIAHELAHVVQQSGAPVQRSLSLGPVDDAFEREADGVAAAVAGGIEAGVEHGDGGGTVRMAPAADAGAAAARQEPGSAKRPATLREAIDAAAFPGRASVDVLHARAVARFEALTGFVSKARDQMRSLRWFFESFDSNYQAGYKRYSEAVAAGREEAQGQQDMVNLMFGIVAGTVAGVFLEVAIPASLIAGTISRAVYLGAAGNAISGSLGTWAGPKVAGTDLRPQDAFSPLLQELAGVRAIERLSEAVLDVVDPGAAKLGAVLVRSGDLRAEMRAARREWSDERMQKEWAELRKADEELQFADYHMEFAAEKLEKLRKHYDGLEVPSSRVLEQDMWLSWMSSLDEDDADVLDLDAIEDRLRSVGVIEWPTRSHLYEQDRGARLRVDFGDWTSSDDEALAVRRAKASMGAVLRRTGVVFGYRGRYSWD